MAATYRSRFLAQLRQNERQMTRLFASIVIQVTSEIVRRANTDGVVPKAALYAIQTVAGQAVTRMFLTGQPGGELSPFTILPDGAVLPTSPYMRALWPVIQQVMRQSVEQQAAMMRRALSKAPDIAASLRATRRNPFTVARQIAEMNTTAFRPNPFAQYEPPHLWVDPRGYTLSDRIWRTAGNTRRRLDLFLEERIAAGQGALAMSRDLERFLLPNRKLLRTHRPYGTDASYDAMRLARTEITRAAARASEMSALLNPFVQGVSTVLSASHPKADICDDAAASGPWPIDQIPPEYQIPMHPHCLCSYRYEMIDNADEVLDRLRDDIRRARGGIVSLIGPLQVAQFVDLLLGKWRQKIG